MSKTINRKGQRLEISQTRDLYIGESIVIAANEFVDYKTNFKAKPFDTLTVQNRDGKKISLKIVSIPSSNFLLLGKIGNKFEPSLLEAVGILWELLKK